jgi:hypothetical protein
MIIQQKKKEILNIIVMNMIMEHFQKVNTKHIIIKTYYLIY